MDLLLPYLGAEWQAAFYWFIPLLTWRFLPVVFCALMLVYCFWQQADSVDFTNRKISLIQTSFSDELLSFPGLPGRLEYRYQVLKQLLEQSKKTNPDLVVLPESALPLYISEFTPTLKKLLAGSGSSDWLIHQYRYRDDGFLNSSNLLLTNNLEVIAEIDKKSPIPLAEPRIWEGLSAQSMVWQGLNLVSVVCSDSFRTQALRPDLKHADLLVVTANDYSLTGSLLPQLHLEMDQIRAAESGVPILRAVNGGPSAVIDNKGRVIRQLEEGYQSILTSRLPASEHSFFINNQYIIGIASMVLIFSTLLGALSIKRYPYAETSEKPSVIWPGLVFFCVLIISSGSWQESRITVKRTENSSAKFQYQHFTIEQFMLRQFGYLTVANGASQKLFNFQTVQLNDFFLEPTSLAAITETTKGRVLILDENGGEVLIYGAEGLQTSNKSQLMRETVSDLIQIKVKKS
ncbi:hypothetical protein GCM10007941_15030 [Amphritea balenae]|nr:hypothetical protein GCM10007941_15030 [Amphritea balenae]